MLENQFQPVFWVVELGLSKQNLWTDLGNKPHTYLALLSLNLTLCYLYLAYCYVLEKWWKKSYILRIGGTRGEGGTLEADISPVGCLPKADTRRQGEGGGVKNPIFEETSFMDVP